MQAQDFYTSFSESLWKDPSDPVLHGVRLVGFISGINDSLFEKLLSHFLSSTISPFLFSFCGMIYGLESPRTDRMTINLSDLYYIA